MNARISSTIIAAASLAALSSLGACRGGRSQAVVPEGAPAVVIFSNESLAEADVFAVPRGGSRLRLGTVQAGRTETLHVPTGGGAGNVTIIARLLARNNVPTTGPLTLGSGERISVRLPIDMRTLNVLPATQ